MTTRHDEGIDYTEIERDSETILKKLKRSLGRNYRVKVEERSFDASYSGTKAWLKLRILISTDHLDDPGGWRRVEINLDHEPGTKAYGVHLKVLRDQRWGGDDTRQGVFKDMKAVTKFILKQVKMMAPKIEG